MSDTPRDGIVLQASGDLYLQMAGRLARSLARHMPGLAIDLFTENEDVDPAPYARVHVGPDFGGSGKIPAMRASRFERSLYLDVDMLAVAPVTDLFEVLDAFDMAMVQDQMRAGPDAKRIWRRPLPPAFPQFNGGLILWRRNPETAAFLETWAAAVAEHGVGKDQPSLRELVWLDRSLRVATLPAEYNLWDLRRIGEMDYQSAAPRILHSNHFKIHAGIEDLDALLPAVLRSHKLAEHLKILLAIDPTLPGPGGAERPMPTPFTRDQLRAKIRASLRDVPRRLKHIRWVLTR